MSRRSVDSFELVLNGGLGNQLFGYAAGKSIERATGLNCRFISPSLGDRKYELHNFGVKAEFRNPLQTHPLSRNLRNRILNRLRPDVFRFYEKSFAFDSRFYDDPAGKTLYGYFQSYRYLENIKDNLLNLPDLHIPFSAEYRLLEEKWAHDRFIAVHIRRGDYLAKEAYHGLVSKEYFRMASNSILDINPSAKFVVFSDSIELARKDFPDADAYISSDNLSKPSENLILMARMGGIIGSNSSLSWWAGFINQRKEVNYYPKPWFAAQHLDTTELLPPEWKTLPSGISWTKDGN